MVASVAFAIIVAMVVLNVLVAIMAGPLAERARKVKDNQAVSQDEPEL